MRFRRDLVEEKSSPGLRAADGRVPDILESIQVNHCRPSCRKFGADPVNWPRRKRGGKRSIDPNDTLVDVQIEKPLRRCGV